MPFRLIAFLLALLAPAAAAVEPREVEPPVTVSVFGDQGRVLGDLTTIREDGLTLDVNGTPTDFAWADLTPGSAFVAVLRAGEPDTAAGWIELVELGRDLGSADQAAHAGRRALQLDPSLRPLVDVALARPLGTLRELPTIETPEPEPAAKVELPASADAGDLPPKFPPVSEEEALQAEQRARDEASRAVEQFGGHLRLVETEHFLIFTDWEPVDDAFLIEQLEGAYALLSREFHVGAEDTVFVGRLPVYMFSSASMMQRYAREFDQYDAGNNVAGYHASRPGGLNKLVMSKPRSTALMGLPAARRQWARTLTHEFVHAFLARYRGGRHLPRWLDEGLAEMLAESVMPAPGYADLVRQVARSGQSITSVFDDRVMPPAEMYPVMLSMTSALYRENPASFVAMVDRIKAGADAEEALREHFGVGYGGLEQAWRNHAAQ